MKKTIIIFLMVFLIAIWGISLSESTEWIVTQYPSVTGKQSMIYTIENVKTGEFAIIDGGYSKDSEQIKDIIDKHGKVDIWILTHFHEDHCGAFNALWNEYESKVQKVYITQFDTDILMNNAQDWDDPDTLSLFKKQTSGNEKIILLHTGDKMDIIGLNMEVFLAGDEEILKYMINVWNNCSVVFKISGSEDDMLFLGDLQNEELGTYLIGRYGETELHAKYIQASHHGNWGLAVEFYSSLNPQAVFFDAPEWIMTGEKFTARFLKEWCDNHNVAVYDYSAAPTSVTIR